MGGKARRSARKKCQHCNQVHNWDESLTFNGSLELQDAFELFIGTRCLNHDLIHELAYAFAAGATFWD